MNAKLVNALQLGRVPRVVGTVITADFLRAWSLQPRALPCDLVELRLDGFVDFRDWLRVGKEIEHRGTPVFATLRLEREGGKWTGADTARWSHLESAIRNLSGVDVELGSEIALAVSELCQQLGKLSVFSFHDFNNTPPQSQLEEVLDRAGALGGIGKIAAKANSAEDLARLRGLLHQPRPAPICVIGMGEIGRESRLSFPREGSCFTYGYLDLPGAPGQYSAAELREHFKQPKG